MFTAPILLETERSQAADILRPGGRPPFGRNFPFFELL